MVVKEFGSFNEDIYLIVPKLDNYQKNNVNILKELLNKQKYNCVYITSSKPYSWIKTYYEKQKIDLSNTLFIDLISKNAKIDTDANNCLFITSPAALTELSIAISEALSNINAEKKVVILDSISTLLIYNSHEITGRFIHVLVSKIRKAESKLVLIVLEKDEKNIENIELFIDKVVRIK